MLPGLLQTVHHHVQHPAQCHDVRECAVSKQALIRRCMHRVTFVPELLCYPKLEALELQNNQIDRVAEQRGLSALASLDLSFNLLHHASVLQSLRFLVSLTELQLTGNAMEQHPG